MQIPNIPTDNLYKFMAITGLLIILISMGFFIYSSTNIKRDIIESRYKVDILRLDVEYWSNDIIELKRLIEEDFFSKLDSNELLRLNITDTSRKSSILLYDYYLKSTKIKDTNLKAAVSVWRESLKRTIDIKKNVINLEYNLNQIDLKMNLLKRYSAISLIGCLVGMLLTMIGFWLWYKKHQKYQDRLIKKGFK